MSKRHATLSHKLVYVDKACSIACGQDIQVGTDEPSIVHP